MKLTQKEEQGLRLRALIKALNLSQKEFSKRIGLTQGYLNQVLSGAKSVSWKMTIGISEGFPMVNQNWLVTGVGEMFLPGDGKEKAVDQVEEPGVVYEADPLASLRRALEGYEARLSAVERRLAELERNQSD